MGIGRKQLENKQYIIHGILILAVSLLFVAYFICGEYLLSFFFNRGWDQIDYQ